MVARCSFSAINFTTSGDVRSVSLEPLLPRQVRSSRVKTRDRRLARKFATARLMRDKGRKKERKKVKEKEGEETFSPPSFRRRFHVGAVSRRRALSETFNWSYESVRGDACINLLPWPWLGGGYKLRKERKKIRNGSRARDGKDLERWPRALPQTIYLAGRNDQTFFPPLASRAMWKIMLPKASRWNNGICPASVRRRRPAVPKRWRTSGGKVKAN